MSWLHYLVEANIYLGVFYLCYCFFLIRDTHYMLNRAYLIFSCVIAFVLPVTQISILKPLVPEIIIEEPVYNAQLTRVSVRPIEIAAPVKHFTFDDAMVYLYIVGVVIALFVLMFRLRKLYILTRNNQALNTDSYKLVKLSDENTAFSFFNYLFIGNNVPQPETVIAHELVHIRQKHSADIIFLEIVKVFNWFNPFIYLIQRSLKTIHEYIADEQTAAREQDALAYSSFLLNNAYGVQGNSIAHSFFNYNLLKKRIIMLNKNRSGKLARLKYLAALPLCAGMLCTSTLVFSKDYGLIELAPRKIIISPPLIDSTKYALKMTDLRNNLSVISDKMVHENPKTRVNTTYTVNTLTEKGKEDLLKIGMRVEIVERGKKEQKPDSATHTLQLTAPDGTKGTSDIVVVENATTGFKQTYAVNSLTDNDFKELKTQGYNLAIIDRPKEWADTGKRLPPPPPPLQKRMPPAQPKKLKDQVKLPPPPPPAVKGVRIPEPVPAKGLRNAPPPPALPKKIKDQVKLPPPPPPIEPKPAKSAKVKPVAPVEIEEPVVATPQNTAIQALYTHLRRTIKYPKEARDVKKEGRVIVTFNVSQGKMENIKVVRSVSPEIDREVINSLESFNKPLPLQANTYSVPLLFTIDNGKAKPSEVREYPLVAYNVPTGNATNLALNEIVIVGYGK